MRSIADWMTERGLRVEDLVDRSGLDKRVVRAILQGHYTPSPQQRQTLAAALGVEASDIAWGHTVAVDHMYGHGPQFGRSP